jgi:hypothetical protein
MGHAQAQQLLAKACELVCAISVHQCTGAVLLLGTPLHAAGLQLRQLQLRAFEGALRTCSALVGTGTVAVSLYQLASQRE